MPKKMLLTTKSVKLIEKKEFVVEPLGSDYETFVVYIAVFNISSDISNKVHLSKRTQNIHLKADKVLKNVSSKYIDFANIFSPKLAIRLLKHISINNNAIKLGNDWQSLYSPIYSFGLIELEILNIYIKNNLINGFIKAFKSPIKTSISLIKN